jgi:hypothetical protein
MAGPLFQFQDSQGREDGDSQGDGQGSHVQDQSQGHSPEGDMGKAVADHGVPLEDEKHPQDGAGHGYAYPGEKSSLHEGVR